MKKKSKKKKYNFQYWIVQIKHKTSGWTPEGKLYCYEPAAILHAEYLSNCGAKTRIRRVKIIE